MFDRDREPRSAPIFEYLDISSSTQTVEQFGLPIKNVTMRAIVSRIDLFFIYLCRRHFFVCLRNARQPKLSGML